MSFCSKTFHPDFHHRRSIRLKRYNYAQDGAYFLTICTKNKQCLFSEIKQHKVSLNNLGAIAYYCWQAIPDHFPNIKLDVFVIMPNHIHGILWVINPHDLRAKASQFGQVTAGSIPNIVRCYKAAVTKQINQVCQQKGTSLIWQRNYYEQVIRDETALNNIRQYIINNPLNWQDDPEYSASKEILLDLPF